MSLKTPYLAAQQSYWHFTYNAYDRGAQNFVGATSKFWTPPGRHYGPNLRAQKYYSPRYTI